MLGDFLMETTGTYSKMLNSLNNLKIESVKDGCGFCMEYDWSIRQEKPSNKIKEYRLENRVINYCPFCGRKVR